MPIKPTYRSNRTQRSLGFYGPFDSSLLTGLVAYWKMEEGPGANRIDATGNGYDLTDVPPNVVGVLPGKIANAAYFNNVTVNHLAYPNDPVFQPGANSFTVAGWAYAESYIQSSLVEMWNPTGNQKGWFLGFHLFASQRFLIGLSDDGATDTILLNAGGVPASLNTWYHVALGWDAAAGLAFIVINAGAPATAAFAGPVAPSTQPLLVGTAWPILLSSHFNGRIDELGYWSRALTPAEITELYNGGAGLSYPF